MKRASFVLALLVLSAGIVRSETIAISYFDNTSGNARYNSLSKGIADMLITDLSRVKGISIVEREKLESLLKEIKLGESKYFDPATAQKLGKGLGAQSILTGSFYILETTIRIDARLINVQTGEIVLAEQVTGSRTDFFALHKKLADALAASLHIDYKPEISNLYQVSKPVDVYAVLKYSNAIQLHDQGMDPEAMKMLTETSSEFPDFAFASDKLEQLKKWLKLQDELLAKRKSQELDGVIAALNARNQNFFRQVDFVWRGLEDANRYTDLLKFNVWLRQQNLDPKTVLPGSHSLDEVIRYYDCRAFSYLKQHDELIEKGTRFISDYPESNHTRMVKFMLENDIEEIERQEKGKVGLEAKVRNATASVTYTRLPRIDYNFISLKEYQRYLELYQPFVPWTQNEDSKSWLDKGLALKAVGNCLELAIYFSDGKKITEIKTGSADLMIGNTDPYLRVEFERQQRKTASYESSLQKSGDFQRQLEKVSAAGNVEEMQKFVSDATGVMAKRYVPIEVYEGLFIRYTTTVKPKGNAHILATAWSDYIKLVRQFKSPSEAKRLIGVFRDNAPRTDPDRSMWMKMVAVAEEDLLDFEIGYGKYLESMKPVDVSKEILLAKADVFERAFQYESQAMVLRDALDHHSLTSEEERELIYDLYYCYGNMGKFDQARGMLARLTEKFPNHKDTLYLIEDEKTLPR